MFSEISQLCFVKSTHVCAVSTQQ